MAPNDDVKVTTVPFCTGVPADSVTEAETSADPFTGTTVVLTVRVIVEEVGASSGTLSHADRVDTATSSAESDRRVRDTGKANKDNRSMRLAGQGSRADQRGYAMAALLVGMSVMAVMMAAALPVWSHAARREREAELIWRGEQYKRAIMLFQRKYANTFPPNIDILVEQKFLRKKYKDPITDDEFQVIPVGGGQPGRPGQPLGAGGATGPAGQTQTPGGFGGAAPAGGFGAAGGGFGGTTPSAGASSGFSQMTPGTQPAMGIQGVTSKSKDASIKLYNGLDRYNQWAFVYLAASTQAGGGGTAFGRPGQGAGGAPQPGRPGAFGNPGGGFGNPGGGFGSPGGGFGAPGGGFGQPTMPPVPGGGFGSPGGGFGSPSQPGQGGFGRPGQPGSASSPGGIFVPSAPGSPGQSVPPFGSGPRPPAR